jgi:DDE superfamily endonuclease
VLHVVRRSPEQFGHPHSRWTLQAVRQTLGWLRHLTLGGVSRLLKRLKISHKRGRLYLHSPDPAYESKRSQIELKRLRVQYQPHREVLVYLDEFTYYRQPTVAYDYEVAGHVYPLARLSYGSNPYQRVIGALNAHTGQVTYRHQAKIGVEAIADFMEDLRQTYPEADTIYVVLDNNPLHFHPTVLSRLHPQVFDWQAVLPPTWSTDVTPGSLPIVFLPLPTYASWLNPIEKLWHWLNRAVLHLHRYAAAWDALQAHVTAFLDQFSTASEPLLRYVGLLPY